MIPVQIVLQEGPHGYAAFVPGLPGLNAQGETQALCVERVRRLVRERLAADPIDQATAAGRVIVIDLDGPFS